MLRAQRIIAIRAIRSYRTTSYEETLFMGRFSPWDLITGAFDDIYE